jgi:hypothetical protein
VLSAECRVQNVEFATIRAAGRDGGTKARRDPPEAGRPRGERRGNCQNGRRRPMAGNRDSGIGNPPEAGRPGTEGVAVYCGSVVCRRRGGPMWPPCRCHGPANSLRPGEAAPKAGRPHRAAPTHVDDRQNPRSHPMQGRRRNILAKAEFAGYTSGRPIGLSSRRLTWRRWGALPLRQTHDTLRPADAGGPNRPRVRGRLIRYSKPGLGC